MKVAFSTLGCRVNVYESEAMAEKFIREGYEVVEPSEVADVYVINTCTVTNQADSKSRKMIRLARKTNPNAILIVCGCSSENHKENIVDVDIDILLGNYNKSKIVDYVETYKKDPLYGKRVKSSKKYAVHDETNKAKVGDTVRIAETRPLSKTKYFYLKEIVKEAVIL